MPKIIIIITISFLLGFILRDIIDGLNILGFVVIRERVIDFTDGKNKLLDYNFEEGK